MAGGSGRRPGKGRGNDLETDVVEGKRETLMMEGEQRLK